MAAQVGDIFFAARAEVVDAQHLVALLEEAVRQVGPDEAGATGDDRAGHGRILGPRRRAVKRG
jgi:hypothetical protein